MIELPEFMSGRVVERTYARANSLQTLGERDAYARRFLEQGLRRARARDPRLLLFLEKGAAYLQARNDEQVSRFAQEGYAKSEFTEFSQWREAFLKASEPGERQDTSFRVFQWIYAAVAEAIQ